MSYKAGTYIWTACSAGWLVLGLVGSGEMCFIVSGACALMAAVWDKTIGQW